MTKTTNYTCIECDNSVCKRTALYGGGKCRRCANLGKNNPAYGKIKTKENNYNWKGGKPTCKLCGKQLTNYRSNMCIECFPKSRKNKPRGGNLRFGENAPSYKHGKSLTPNYCKQCGKKISWQAEKCYECWNKTNIGKNHHSYIHGRGNAPYPLVFSKLLKQKIKIRDNYQCQRCGITEIKHKEKYNQKLHVHHIDYNKENCNENNLITTCCYCNIQANYNRDYWYAYYTYLIKENYEK